MTDTDDVLMVEDRDLLGYTVGFVQPGGVLHCDTIQIRRFSGYWAKYAHTNVYMHVSSTDTHARTRPCARTCMGTNKYMYNSVATGPSMYTPT